MTTRGRIVRNNSSWVPSRGNSTPSSGLSQRRSSLGGCQRRADFKTWHSGQEAARRACRNRRKRLFRIRVRVPPLRGSPRPFLGRASHSGQANRSRPKTGELHLQAQARISGLLFACKMRGASLFRFPHFAEQVECVLEAAGSIAWKNEDHGFIAPLARKRDPDPPAMACPRQLSLHLFSWLWFSIALSTARVPPSIDLSSQPAPRTAVLFLVVFLPARAAGGLLCA